jgi:hypothetical protein
MGSIGPMHHTIPADYATAAAKEVLHHLKGNRRAFAKEFLG